MRRTSLLVGALVSLSSARAANLPLAVKTEPLEDRQWGLSNEGREQIYDVDDITTKAMPAKIGEDIQLPQDDGKPKRPVLVAVLDSGIDWHHPNLAGAIVEKKAECEALQKYLACRDAHASDDDGKDICDKNPGTPDTDGNGYAMDCHGWNFVSNSDATYNNYPQADSSDVLGHGTHVAGIIAGRANGVGIRGVSQNAVILPVKIEDVAPNSPVRLMDTREKIPSQDSDFGAGPSSYVDTIARGLLYAIKSKAEIINLSMGWPAAVNTPKMMALLKLALKEKTLVVAAAGNDATEARVYPCALEGVICVGAHGPDGSFSHFSNWGLAVDVAAPGLNILSTWPMDLRPEKYTSSHGFEFLDGTSMATPFVSGALAELLSRGYSSEEAYYRLLAGSRQIQNTGKDFLLDPQEHRSIDSGLLDISRSLSIPPQSLLMPTSKKPLRLAWDRSQSALPLEFTLTNKGIADAGKTEITLSLRDSFEDSPSSAEVAQKTFSLESWGPGQSQKISTTLLIHSSDVDGRLRLLIDVKTENPQKQRRLEWPIEIFVPLTPKTQLAGVEAFTLDGAFVSKDFNFLNVEDPFLLAKSPEYVNFFSRNDLWSLQIVHQSAKTYEAGPVFSMKSLGPQAQPLWIYKIPVGPKKTTGYAFVFCSRVGGNRCLDNYSIFFLDEKLKPVADNIAGDTVLNYTSEKLTVPPDHFDWIEVHRDEGVELLPVWIGLGKIPPLEQPAPNPWHPVAKEKPETRLYYLDFKGLHSLPLDSDELPLALLEGPQLKILTAKGDSENQDYFLSEFDTKPRLIQKKTLVFDEIRQLAGIRPSSISDALSLNLDGNEFFAKVFTGPAYPGALKISILPWDGVESVKSFDLDLGTSMDALLSVIGYFGSDRLLDRAEVFAQSNYEIRYFDLRHKTKAGTSLEKFTFIPEFLTSPTLQSVRIVTQGKNKSVKDEISAGVFVPEATAATFENEVVMTALGQDHQVKGLYRPAWFRLLPTNDCESAAQIFHTHQGIDKVVTVCGAVVLQAPLILESKQLGVALH